MRYALARPDYEDLFLPLAGPDDDRAEVLAATYPKTTEGAVTELRSRGLDASEAVIHHLLKTGELPRPRAGFGRNLRWAPEEIDQAAELLDRRGRWTDEAIARYVLRLHPGQALRARRQIETAHPAANVDRFTLVIHPAAIPADAQYTAGPYATLQYLPVPADDPPAIPQPEAA